MRPDDNQKTAAFILDNIRREDDTELRALFGNNYRKRVEKSLNTLEMQVLCGRDSGGNKVPVAIGGVTGISSDIACVWLLSSRFAVLNKTALTKIIMREIRTALKKYKILYNFIHPANIEMKHLLQKIGFNFDGERKIPVAGIPDEFEFFYAINERKE